MTRIIFSVGLAFGLLSFTDTAIGDYVIWDEAIDGDLSNFVGNPTDVTLTLGPFDFVLGSVGGNSDPNIGDGYDVFATQPFIENCWVYFGLESYETVANNANSQLDIYEFFSRDLLYSTTISEADIGVNLVRQFYDLPYIVVSVSEFDVTEQGYSFRLSQVIPEPSSTFVLAVATLGLIGVRKR